MKNKSETVRALLIILMAMSLANGWLSYRALTILEPESKLPTYDVPKDTRLSHFTQYEPDGNFIFDMPQSDWSNATILERVQFHLAFMNKYNWPEDKKIAVIRATLEGK